MTNKEQNEIQQEIAKLNKTLNTLRDERDINSVDAHQKMWDKYKPKIQKIKDKIKQIQGGCAHKFRNSKKKDFKECSLCGFETHKDLI
jgi:uncharacterized protein YukE